MAPKGTLALSSASPGAVVREDSPPVFMIDLIKELKAADWSAERAFSRTRMDVARDTQNLQVPWLSSSLDDEFVLAATGTNGRPAPCVVPATPVANAEPPVAPTPKPTPAPEAETPHVAVATPKPSPQPSPTPARLQPTTNPHPTTTRRMSPTSAARPARRNGGLSIASPVVRQERQLHGCNQGL